MMKLLLIALLFSCALLSQGAPKRPPRQYGENFPVEETTVSEVRPDVEVSTAAVPVQPELTVTETPEIVTETQPIVTETQPNPTVVEVQPEVTETEAQPDPTVVEVQPEVTEAPEVDVTLVPRVATTLISHPVQKVVPQIVTDEILEPKILTTQETFTVTRIEPMTTIITDTYQKPVIATEMTAVKIPEERTTVAERAEIRPVQTSQIVQPASAQSAQVVQPAPAIASNNTIPAAPAVASTNTVPVETLDMIKQQNRMRVEKIMAGYLKHLEMVASQQAAVAEQQERIQAQVQQNIANAQRGIYTPVTLAPVTIGQPRAAPIAVGQVNTVPATYTTIEDQIKAQQAHVQTIQAQALANAQKLQEENNKRLDAFYQQQRSYLASLGLPTYAPPASITPTAYVAPPAINPQAFAPQEPIVPTASDCVTTTEPILTRLKRQNQERIADIKKNLAEQQQKLRNSLLPANTVAPITNSPLITTPVPVNTTPIPAQPVAVASSAVPDYQAQLKQQMEKLAADAKIQHEKNKKALDDSIAKAKADWQATLDKLKITAAPVTLAPATLAPVTLAPATITPAVKA